MIQAPKATYKVGGAVSLSDIYIRRDADRELLEACMDREYASVLSSRQVGKSSLIVRICDRLRQDGINAIWVDMSTLAKSAEQEMFYFTLLELIAWRMDVDDQLWMAKFTQLEGISYPVRFERCMTEAILPACGSLIIFLDEIDSTLGLPYKDDLFAVIRALYNRRAQDPALKNLSFVLVGATPPSALIDDPKRTPFNIGRNIEIKDFTYENALPLRDGLPHLDSQLKDRLLRQVLEWTGGHPYLTVRAMSELAQNPEKENVDELVAGIYLGASNRDSEAHFQYMSKVLLSDTFPDRDLVKAYRDVLRNGAKYDPQNIAQAWLKVCGIVRVENGRLEPRNRIYRRVFDAAWTSQYLPPSRFVVMVEQWFRRYIWVGPLAAVALLAVGGYAGYLTKKLSDGRSELTAARSTFARDQKKATDELGIERAKVAEGEEKNAKTNARLDQMAELVKTEQQNLSKAIADSEATRKVTASLGARALLRNIFTTQPQSSALLAVQSAHLTPGIPAAAHLHTHLKIFEHVAAAHPLPGRERDTCLVAWSPDGQQLACAVSGSIFSWRGTEAREQKLPIPGRPRAFAWGTLGKVAVFTTEGKIQASVEDKAYKLRNVTSGGERLLVSPDGTQLLIQENPLPRLTHLYNLRDGKRLIEPTPTDNDLFWAPDSRHLFAYATQRTGLRLQRYNPRNPETPLEEIDLRVPTTARPIGNGLFLRDGDSLFQLNYGQATIQSRLGKLQSGEAIAGSSSVAIWSTTSLKVYALSLISVSLGDTWHSGAWSPDQRTFAIASPGKVWRLRPAREAMGLSRDTLALIWDADKLLTLKADSINFALGDEAARQPAEGERFKALAVSPLGSRYAIVVETGEKDAKKSHIVIEQRGGARSAPIEIQDWKTIQTVTWDPSGNQLLVTGERFGLQCKPSLRCPTVATIASPSGNVQANFPYPVRTVFWSRDGSIAVLDDTQLESSAAGATYRLRHFDPRTAKEQKSDRIEIPGGAAVGAAVWSADGQQLATLSMDKKTLQVLDGKLSLLWQAPACKSEWNGFRWHPKQAILASSCGSRIHLTEPLAKVSSPMELNDVVAAFAWRPDGNALAVGADGLRILDLDSKKLSAQLCAKLPYNLSPRTWTTLFGNQRYTESCPGLPPAPEGEGIVQ